MGNIGLRLKEERDSLGFEPGVFAHACGAGKSSQYRYESGERSPDGEYLAKAAELGIDVVYVLTGQRGVVCVAEAKTSAYSPAEHLAQFISTLKLSAEDAETLKKLAERLSIK